MLSDDIFNDNKSNQKLSRMCQFYSYNFKPCDYHCKFCLSQNVFQDRMKIAQVVPLNKKDKYLGEGKL